MTPLDTLVEGLTRAEKIEFAQALSYITERLDNNMGQSPEGGIGQILNKLSPPVRDKFMLLSNVMETPRVAPFAPKLSEEDYANELGLDPEYALTAKAALDGQYVMGKLQERMGTDSNRPKESPTRREQIAAALEAANFPE